MRRWKEFAAASSSITTINMNFAAASYSMQVKSGMIYSANKKIPTQSSQPCCIFNDVKDMVKGKKHL